MKRRYVFLALLALAIGGSFLAFHRTLFATLDLGKGHTMHFYGRRGNELNALLQDMPTFAHSCLLDYESRRDPRVLWKRRLSMVPKPPSKYRFKAHTSSDGDVVGVVETSMPSRVFHLRNLIGGEAWPDQAENEKHLVVLKRGERLLARLQSAVPYPLSLSDGVE